MKQRFLQILIMNINVLLLMPEPSSSLKWPFGGELLACRIRDWREVPWRTCFVSETRRKVDALGSEPVRCLTIRNRSFEKKAKESHILKGKLNGHLRDS